MRKVILLFCTILICSCESRQNNLAFYDDSDVETEDDISEAAITGQNIVSIPFRECGGVKYIAVTINGLECDMIFDTGCSSTLISVAEANYLYQKGRLSENDIIGFGESQIADGSIVENMIINLTEVVVGGKIVCNNVRAVVSNNSQAPLLLGNEILDRATSYSVDNESHNINFEL